MMLNSNKTSVLKNILAEVYLSSLFTLSRKKVMRFNIYHIWTNIILWYAIILIINGLPLGIVYLISIIDLVVLNNLNSDFIHHTLRELVIQIFWMLWELSIHWYNNFWDMIVRLLLFYFILLLYCCLLVRFRIVLF